MVLRGDESARRKSIYHTEILMGGILLLYKGIRDGTSIPY